MSWTPEEQALLESLDDPAGIQAFLNSIAYSGDPVYRCPRSVMRDRVAHCFDGALLAAAALRRLGHPPLLVDLRAEKDDDHVIVLFRRHGHLGAVAKSNFVGLRYREPIFRTLRELVLSYFESYYSIAGEKSLRAYSRPFDLRRVDHLQWSERDEAMEVIARRLDALHHVPIAAPEMVAAYAPVDERTYRAGMLGVNEAGLWKPPG